MTRRPRKRDRTVLWANARSPKMILPSALSNTRVQLASCLSTNPEGKEVIAVKTKSLKLLRWRRPSKPLSARVPRLEDPPIAVSSSATTPPMRMKPMNDREPERPEVGRSGISTICGRFEGRRWPSSSRAPQVLAEPRDRTLGQVRLIGEAPIDRRMTFSVVTRVFRGLAQHTQPHKDLFGL
jgi:hypothetical protein